MSGYKFGMTVCDKDGIPTNHDYWFTTKSALARQVIIELSMGRTVLLRLEEWHSDYTPWWRRLFGGRRGKRVRR